MIRLVACLVLISSAACSSSPSQPEASVRPGVNEAYSEPDVSTWVERFEREGREIYDLRSEIVEACMLQPGDDVADVGAGTGLFVPLLSDAVGRTGSSGPPDWRQGCSGRVDRPLWRAISARARARSRRVPAGPNGQVMPSVRVSSPGDAAPDSHTA